MSEHGHPADPERVDAARQRGLPLEDARALDSLLSLLADTVRARILVALVETGEICVGDLALALGISKDSASYRLHDGELRDGLVAAVEQLRVLCRTHLERVPEDDG